MRFVTKLRKYCTVASFHVKTLKSTKYPYFSFLRHHSYNHKKQSVRVPKDRGPCKFAKFYTAGGDGLPFALA